MKTTDLRNVVLLGHGGVGKTTLAEAMLFNAKAIDRLGRIADGNTTLDYDAEEQKRQVSINTAVAPFEWKNQKLILSILQVILTLWEKCMKVFLLPILQS